MNVRDFAEMAEDVCRDVAVHHAVTIEEAMIYRIIAPEPFVRAACRLHDYGFPHWQITRALMSSEATTAFGMAYWIATHINHLHPDDLPHLAWHDALRGGA